MGGRRILPETIMGRTALVGTGFVALLRASGAGARLGALPTFIVAAVALVPLAAVLGRATEDLSEHIGDGLAGLVNATFGNAAELIIGFLALRAGLPQLVKASIAGSILGNTLLVFGASAVAGGIRRPELRFQKTAANAGGTMLALSSVALLVPAIFHALVGGPRGLPEGKLSVEIAAVQLVTYFGLVAFTLGTHRHLFGQPAVERAAGRATTRNRALIVLLAATAATVLVSEVLVRSVEAAAHAAGLTDLFVGIVIVALVGNAAEHSTAVLMARKGHMDAALQIAGGSSVQVALLVAPVLVVASYFVGPTPMNLVFTPLEVVAVALAVGTLVLVTQDGESNWLEGLGLLAVYAILALMFLAVPA